MRKWITLLGLAALAVLGLGYWGYQQYTNRQLLQTALGNNYLRAFYNASYHVQNAQVLLGKSLVASGPGQYEQLFEQIWIQSNQALDNLSQLPVGDALLGRTNKFITQLGDYSRMLSEQVALGKPVTGEQWNTLNRLYNQASDLNSELRKIHADVADGRLNFFELAAAGSTRLAREGRKLASANFQEVDREMQGYPTLIYDGPFSDHMERSEARGVTGTMINENEAKSIARKFYDNKGEDNIIARVTGSVEGNIPAYRVEMVRRSGGKVRGEPAVADISKKGGHLIWMIIPRNITRAGWSIEQAGARAGEYLESHGYRNMTMSYYQRNDNTVTFNYALTQDGVIIYPDLVKVTVALDNGQVVGVDARGYLMSHRKRSLPRPGLTEQQARTLVNEKLNLQGRGRLALIPLEVDRERLTWEFKGTLGPDTYLVYINALDGNEEKVLKLIQTRDGALTM
ncbi:germination protein YpeB [Desulfallas sp. Bu1-1]|uniref:germination protein YpeB n=1 Tax=Desulfallas sp. Bu1-1 TaxID=2787620 RepID=UPI00189C68ED|nr:germination protein YpeB [Desulfallas sp. Bu1-1]MBF7081482.1 germination protein YpeB [Desulfallas sp. Bu1-1]